MLQRVQNCALRIILQADKRTHIAEMHQALDLMYTADRRHMHTLLQTNKCLNELVPAKVCSQLMKIETVHNRQTRSATQQELYIPFRRLDLTKKAFRIRGPSLWTLVDDDLKDKPSIDSFKHGLMKSDMFEVVN